MRLASANDAYLSGHSFSKAYGFALEPDEEDACVEQRQDVLVRLCRAKRVIHAGCVDHSVNTITQKSAAGMWLHSKLADAAARCLGVDTNEAGIDHLRSQLGYTDVIAADIATGLPEPYRTREWDYLLLPEILEHIDNPVWFLTRVHAQFRDITRAVVVTVPNAFSRGNFRRACKGQECINSDHRYWFTPFTIAKVLVRAGFQIDTLRLCVSWPLRRPAIMRRWYYARRPLVRDSIVVLATFQARSLDSSVARQSWNTANTDATATSDSML